MYWILIILFSCIALSGFVYTMATASSYDYRKHKNIAHRAWLALIIGILGMCIIHKMMLEGWL